LRDKLVCGFEDEYACCVVANVALTLADILGGIETGDLGPCNGQRVQLSSSQRTDYADWIPGEARGHLELKEIYKETFLLCHAFIGGTDVVLDLCWSKSKYINTYNRTMLCRGFMCNYCMQRAAIPACNNCRLSNVLENIHGAKVLQPITAFGGIT